MTPLCTNSRAATPVRARGGFALMITLALLAFAVLLLFSLLTLARLDSAAAIRSRESAVARQHARFALQIAIGRLQACAGPDRRVTARADIGVNPVNHPYWTGVWAAESEPLTWLVSGNETAPLAVTPDREPVPDPEPENDSVWLLRAPVDPAAGGIKLMRQPLHAASLPGLDGVRLTGHYAWWAGDEGVKAKFNLVNPYAGAPPGTPENRRQFLSAHQYGIEKIDSAFVGYEAAKRDTAEGAALRDRLGRVVTLNQLPYADSAIGLTALRTRFHDLTTCSLGVLADARDGGLRYDLTRGLETGAAQPSGAVFPGGPAWDLLRSFAGLRPETIGGVEMVTPGVSTETDQGIHPIVILVQMGWGGDVADGRLRLLLEPLIVLANPYDVALAPASYRLVWHQTGAIELRNPPGAEDAAVAAGSPADLLGGDPEFLIADAGFRPGEARAFALPTDVVWVPGAPLVLSAGYACGRAAHDRPEAAHESARELQVRVAGGATGFEFSLAGGGILQLATDCAAREAEASGPAPVTGVPARTGLRMGDADENAPGDASGLRWLADFNLRAPVIGALPSWGRNPLYGDVATADGVLLDGSGICWGPAHRAIDGGRTFVTLLHVPREALHSLGQLQHARLHSGAATPGRSVGESYADPHSPDGVEDFSLRINEALWDRYFFSTMPSDGNVPLNHRLAPYASDGVPATDEAMHNPATAAAHLLVDGPFNVNSTSIEAWQALLASLNGQRMVWSDPATGATSAVTIGSGFPHSGVVGGGADDAWCGYRELDDAQLHDLAADLVSRLRTHGPFHSLAEFVNRPLHAPAEEERWRGALQAALDDVVNPPPSLDPLNGLPAEVGPSPLLAWPEAGRGHPATLAPGWLTQADVLSILGPVLAVRSDTYLVRAYGDATNPATGATTARAWCEAIVLRVPEYVDPANSAESTTALTATNATFGRRFRIVRFRWLSPDEV